MPARKPGKGKVISAPPLPPAQGKEKVSNYDPNRSAYSKENQDKKPRSRRTHKKNHAPMGMDERLYGSRRPEAQVRSDQDAHRAHPHRKSGG